MASVTTDPKLRTSALGAKNVCKLTKFRVLFRMIFKDFFSFFGCVGSLLLCAGFL